MDLREKKTIRNIKNAFIELRSKKDVEKITVKELADKAEISKSTFYLHYADIYAISEELENEIIADITAGIDGRTIVENPASVTRTLALAFLGRESLISVLFSGGRASILPARLEENLVKKVAEIKPSTLKDPAFSVTLSCRVYGGFYAYFKHRKNFKTEDIISALESLVRSPSA